MEDEKGSEEIRPRYGAIGCMLGFAGLFAGGMIAVAIAKLVGMLRNCTPSEGLPACDYEVYLLGGMIIGAVTLPGLTLWRIRRRAAPTTNPERS